MCDKSQFSYKTDYFTNSDNLKLYEQIWIPNYEKHTRAFVFIVHGLNEHSSFYYEDSVVKPLIKIGCIVAAHDHVGHGRSDGDRMIVGNIDNLARDVIDHIKDLLHRKVILESTPIFLYGHSMGGLIACMIALDQTELISGMILEAPAVNVGDTAASSWVKLIAARLLAYVVPSWIIRKPLFTNLSRNMSIVDAARYDEFRNKDGLTWATAVNVTNAVLDIQPKLKRINIPFLVVHGEKDSIVSIEASRLLMKKASSEDKCFHMYNEALHLLREDSCDVNEDFKNRMVQWLSKHII